MADAAYQPCFLGGVMGEQTTTTIYEAPALVELGEFQRRTQRVLAGQEDRSGT